MLLDVKVNLFKYINPSGFQQPQVRERKPKGKLPVSLGKKLGPKSEVPQSVVGCITLRLRVKLLQTPPCPPLPEKCCEPLRKLVVGATGLNCSVLSDSL